MLNGCVIKISTNGKSIRSESESETDVSKDEKDNKEEDRKDTKDKVKDKESKQFQDVVIFNIGNCCGGECSNNCEEKAKKISSFIQLLS